MHTYIHYLPNKIILAPYSNIFPTDTHIHTYIHTYIHYLPNTIILASYSNISPTDTHMYTHTYIHTLLT
jgi:hypothetical protein